MGFRTTTSVSSVTRQWRRWTISYLAVCSAETSNVWAGCLRWLRLDAMVHVQEENTMQWWSTVRKLIPKMLRRGFDSIFLLVGWLLWKERNARTFNRVASTTMKQLKLIEDEVTMWIAAGNRHLAFLEQRRTTLAVASTSRN